MNLLFLTLISFSLAFGLRLNDVCKMNESQCKGRYDSDFQYKEYCEKECIGKQMYKCTLDHCAIDKKSCQNFKHLNQVVKSINRLQVFNKELEKYKASLNSVSECQSSNYTYHSNDVCINGLNCHFIQKYIIRNSKYNLFKPVVCQCSGFHSYHCGKYCTVHKTACSNLMNKTSDQVIQSCDNGNNKYERKILLF